MAKETILKDLDTGDVLYPHTLASLVRTSNGGNVDEALVALSASKAQFSISGRCYDNVGNNLADGQFVRTPLIPLNRRCELRTNARGTADKVPYVAFFDATGAYISGLFDATNDEKIVAVEQYPQNAVYFALSNHEIFGSAHYDNGQTVEQRQEAVVNAIMAAKLALFIDQWNEAWGSYGGYDAGATDGKPFLGNGLRMSYEEALEVYKHRHTWPYLTSLSSSKCRTNLATLPETWGNACECHIGYAFSGEQLEVVRVGSNESRGISLSADSRGVFFNSHKLRKVIGYIDLNAFPTIFDHVLFHTASRYLPQIEQLKLSHVRCSTRTFKDSPNIGLESLSWLVSNAANTAPITVTVHPDVYAKLTDADNAQWSAVLDAAIAKDITFATV